jgi:hypothetical protein
LVFDDPRVSCERNEQQQGKLSENDDLGDGDAGDAEEDAIEPLGIGIAEADFGRGGLLGGSDVGGGRIHKSPLRWCGG